MQHKNQKQLTNWQCCCSYPCNLIASTKIMWISTERKTVKPYNMWILHTYFSQYMFFSLFKYNTNLQTFPPLFTSQIFNHIHYTSLHVPIYIYGLILSHHRFFHSFFFLINIQETTYTHHILFSRLVKYNVFWNNNESYFWGGPWI